MSTPVVAVVGRPNVGKSTLFNKLIGRRLSIVEDTPGVTRDRIYAPCEWSGRKFLLVDTGGLEPHSNDPILSQMRRQAQLAMEAASVIILVTDVRDGVTATDMEVTQMLQKSGKPVVLCVNKCDSIGALPAEYYEFYNLGLGDPIPVSSVHGTGTGDLLDAVLANLPLPETEQEDEDTVKVAVVGKPNVGKSSLINRIAGEERVIVSDVAGTTRTPPTSPSTTSTEIFSLLIPPECGGKAGYWIKLNSTACFGPRWRWTAATSAAFCWMPQWASPNRTARWRATPTSRARAASLW